MGLRVYGVEGLRLKAYFFLGGGGGGVGGGKGVGVVGI